MLFKRVLVFLAISLMVSATILFRPSYAQPDHSENESRDNTSEEVKAVTPVEKEAKDKPKEETGSANPMVLMETSLGRIKVELFIKEAPETVKNFLSYVKEKFYDGTIFHRVVPNFVIQGGGFTADMVQKPTHPAIKNEAAKRIKNTTGTVAMARTSEVDSATSQFFINLKDNMFLDHKDETGPGYGYCVFGKVIEGMDVVMNIGKVSTTTKGFHRDVPVTPVFIKSIRLL
ncbi:MAG: peptidylprolyl isomerase [bacterium]